jgi:hypothetical protein
MAKTIAGEGFDVEIVGVVFIDQAEKPQTIAATN